MRWKRWKTGLWAVVLVLVGGCTALFLSAVGACEVQAGNPYEKDGICFARSLPGATSRFVAFTPVSCIDSARAMGEAVGADYGTLRFEDVDGDGRPEAVIESSAFRCRWGVAPCYDAYRIVLRVCPSCAVPVQEVDRVFLKELTVDDSTPSPGVR